MGFCFYSVSYFGYFLAIARVANWVAIGFAQGNRTKMPAFGAIFMFGFVAAATLGVAVYTKWFFVCCACVHGLAPFAIYAPLVFELVLFAEL